MPDVSSTGSLLGQGFLLGLAMGTTCLATCGPIYGPFMLQRARGIGGSLRAMLGIFGGRFVAYALFGAAAGIVGAKTALLHRPYFTIAAYGLSAALLIASAFVSVRFERSCAAARWSRAAGSPFLLGAVTGINFCPSFLVALTKAVVAGGSWAGAVFFVFFFLGTSVYMLPLTALGLAGERKAFRLVGRIASIAVAGWLLYSAAAIIVTLDAGR